MGQGVHPYKGVGVRPWRFGRQLFFQREVWDLDLVHQAPEFPNVYLQRPLLSLFSGILNESQECPKPCRQDLRLGASLAELLTFHYTSYNPALKSAKIILYGRQRL